MSVRLRAEAESDLRDAAAWYEGQHAGLGAEFLDEVLRSLASIAENPERYPKVHKDIRRAVTSRFPFSIFYFTSTVDEIVLAVMHSSRDPGRWKRRT